MALMWHAGEPQDGVLWVEINWKERPVNALSRDTLNELSELIGRIRSESAITGVVFKSGKSGNFIAGADVTEFQKIRSPEEARQFVLQGQQIFDDLASLKVPTVALISGACLGGGLEFALSCRWRIADVGRKTQIGLPEVMLGIVPGWGGTLRLPKTIGFAEAVPLLLTGRALNGRQAARKGLVHDAVPNEALDHVAHTLLATGGRNVRPRKSGLVASLIDRLGPLKKLVLWQATRQVLKTTHGHYPAPFEIIDVLRDGIGVSPDVHLAHVRDANVRLGQKPVTRELVRLFFLSEGAKKVSESLGVSVDADSIEHAAVIGAGAMGAGIALLAARRGIWTRLKDINAEFVSRGMASVRKLISTDVKRRRITALEGTQALDHLSPATDYRGLRQADVIVEAVVEEIDIKHQVFTELSAATGPKCALATNTSSLTVAAIAAGVPDPSRVVGLHFFNPPHQMPLVEVVRGPQSDPQMVAKAAALASRMGKTLVLVGDCAGFLVNRILAPYMNEAGHLVAEVADPLEIDRAAIEFGMPMGPLALIDLVGLAVSAHVSENLRAAYGERMEPAPIWQGLRQSTSSSKGAASKGGGMKVIEKTWFGKRLNPRVQEAARRSPSRKLVLSHEEIIQRLVYPLINEATRCLEEKVVEKADDIDLAMVFGTGFAPFRGGPLRYADSVGLPKIVQTLDRLAAGAPRFAPCDRLRRMAAANERFHPVEI
jgi:3-hydroxyacyl-CoA dehydrogenase / enoyl-CoA hydratase / 3-hydroxybutyryl-CoA epimerase